MRVQRLVRGKSVYLDSFITVPGLSGEKHRRSDFPLVLFPSSSQLVLTRRVSFSLTTIRTSLRMFGFQHSVLCSTFKSR